MPSEQPLEIPQIEVSPITEQELQKPGAVKLLCKRNAELETENRNLKSEIVSERSRRDQMSTQFHEADARTQVLQERQSSLGDRNAICQLIWGALAINISFCIEFGRSRRWTDLVLSLITLALLAVAVYLANRAPKPKRREAAREAANTG